ncbi:MAG: methyltransferase [Planctomycetota bacterium]
MIVHLADASVDGPAELHDSFRFEQVFFVGGRTQGEFVSLHDWITQAAASRELGDCILQMDIEGWEYESLAAVPSSTLSLFRVLIIEFHFLDELWTGTRGAAIQSVLLRLLETHACVHIPPNNCCGAVTYFGVSVPRVMEFTFLRRDRLLSGGYRHQFPHPEDRDNVAEKPRLLLPSAWRAKAMAR